MCYLVQCHAYPTKFLLGGGSFRNRKLGHRHPRSAMDLGRGLVNGLKL